MKISSVFLLLSLAFSLVVRAISFTFTVLLLVFFSVLVLIITPLWCGEILCSRRVSAKFTSLNKCKDYLDWMFSNSPAISGDVHLEGLRLWGWEFVYRR